MSIVTIQRVLAAALPILLLQPVHGQSFVGRSGNRFMLNGSPVYPLGANAYFLREKAALGDTASVQRVLSRAASLGMTVIRSWAFFDSADSTNPAVIQYRPGVFSENALRALDYVIHQASRYHVRLILPLVNSWDDYGGMNQYVRWRSSSGPAMAPRSLARVAPSVVRGAMGRSYQVYSANRYGHDDFYTDSLMQSWFAAYAVMLTSRVNSLTGIRYRDDSTIFGWELANEPRSSDRSGRIVFEWLTRMATFLKSVDPNHLVGTGEEGMDVTASGYSSTPYVGQSWLFDGTTGASFSDNISIHAIDFAGIHLYPAAWGIPNSAGNAWIDDHIRLADGRSKPLFMGEFGVSADRGTTYESWLTTLLLDGGSGAAVWQLLDSGMVDAEGYGIQCPSPDQACSVLAEMADAYNAKSRTGSVPLPSDVTLLQNYPNPFNHQTVITYTLPAEGHVRLELFNILGERVMTLVDADRNGGTRKELLDGARLPSGAYFYRLTVSSAGSTTDVDRKLLLLK